MPGVSCGDGGEQFLFGENIIIVATDNNNEQVEMNNTFKYYNVLNKQRSLLNGHA